MMVTTIGVSYAIPAGIAGVVLTSAAALSSLNGAAIAAAVAALTVGISGVVAMRRLQAPTVAGQNPPATTAEPTYRTAA
jgi:hypothetical protein